MKITNVENGIMITLNIPSDMIDRILTKQDEFKLKNDRLPRWLILSPEYCYYFRIPGLEFISRYCGFATSISPIKFSGMKIIPTEKRDTIEVF